MSEKYGEQFIDWLVEAGYSTCFFVAGGNTMHLLAAARSRVICIPVVHEVSAVIAAEYFNEHSENERAFAMVTAGPGLTNALTGIAGAWLESRELLVIGGQVKSSDLATDGLRQRGIQEIGGVNLVSSISKASVLIDRPLPKNEILRLCALSSAPRKGPVFLEFCLDIQGAPYEEPIVNEQVHTPPMACASNADVKKLQELLQRAERPVLLLGGGVDRVTSGGLREHFNHMRIPVMTSWNGADRFSSDNEMWFGRPDTWGMRFSNLLIQQADLVVALGARLSMQQTGFNWQQFVPNGQVVHIDIDTAETSKGHPSTNWALNVDVNDLLQRLIPITTGDCEEWITHCSQVKQLLPLNDPANETAEGFVSPYKFAEELSRICDSSVSIVPCSSGGANTVMMQSFLNKTGQIFFNNKALASMGYGLAGAIGASIANRESKVVLVEGDGGFSQNSQDLATTAAQNLNLKMFVFSNHGYASIRMTQRNYFGGDYVGCDTETGLGFPDWEKLAMAYGIGFARVTPETLTSLGSSKEWTEPGPVLFSVEIDPEQTYFPKITSRIAADGRMESAPLHEMSPELPYEIQNLVKLRMA